MHAIVDNKRRVVLPKSVKPGLVFRIAETPVGFELVRLEPARPRKARLIKRGGMAYLDNGCELTNEDLEQACREIFD